MLKSYAGKKISPITEQTTVDFISVAFCIYHCFFFFFQIHFWWCQMLTPNDLRQLALRLPEICCLRFPPLVVNLVTLQSEVRLKPHGVGQKSSWGGMFPLRLLLLRGEYSA